MFLNGLEPLTSVLLGRRSNQLSYKNNKIYCFKKKKYSRAVSICRLRLIRAKFLPLNYGNIMREGIATFPILIYIIISLYTFMDIKKLQKIHDKYIIIFFLITYKIVIIVIIVIIDIIVIIIEGVIYICIINY